MPADISNLSAVHPSAEIDDDVTIGPFCTIGPDVVIRAGTHLHNNVTLMGRVVLGCDNTIYPNVVIGGEPQDISYGGGDTSVVIGDGNLIREGVTINRASEKEEGITWVGDRNFLMANTHVAHDCRLGNHIIMANGSLLGGHVHIQDHASISGGVAVHHYTDDRQLQFHFRLESRAARRPPVYARGRFARPPPLYQHRGPQAE